MNEKEGKVIKWYAALCLSASIGFVVYGSYIYKPEPDHVFVHEYIGKVKDIRYATTGGRETSTMQGVLTIGNKTYLMCWIQPEDRKISDIPIGVKAWYEDAILHNSRNQMLWFEIPGHKEHVGYLLDPHQP